MAQILKTEMRNPNSMNIDKMSSLEIAKVMQQENINAAKAVDAVLGQVAKAIDEISSRMKKGGRLFYTGCGTSGRLGVLDASECPPTFGVSPDLVVGIIAGGDGALRRATEGSEDSYESGVGDIKAYGICQNDCLIGISVAGGAAYVIGSLDEAKRVGAYTIGLTCNEGSKIDTMCDIGIHPDTGAEVITGSSRLKAGTAHKMILNMISTGVMVKMGYVYENLMINLRPSNIKLKNRMIRIVSDITGESLEYSEKLLNENDFTIKKAIASYKGEE